MLTRLTHAGRSVFPVLRQHWLAAILVVLGIALRAITMAAYHPALLYVDSLKYLYGAWPGSDPIGYSILLKSVLLVGDLGFVVFLQHLLGVAIAVVLYILLLRKGVNRWLSALAIAPILLDAYQLQAEQTIMPDIAFQGLVFLGLVILIWKPAASLLTVVVAGLVLGAAVTVHQVGLILIVPIVAYLLIGRGPLFGRGGWRQAVGKSVAIAVAFAVPVVGYQLQLSPARHDRGGQSERASEALSRAHNLFGRLSVDEKHASKRKDETNAHFPRHGVVSKSLRNC